MEFVERAEDIPEPISIARCRELLGEEAEAMSDQEVEWIRRHAETKAQGRARSQILQKRTRRPTLGSPPSRRRSRCAAVVDNLRLAW